MLSRVILGSSQFRRTSYCPYFFCMLCGVAICSALSFPFLF
uniref:Uncharacterized protein n=1 Tax=Rhizophora mucronata TaxID=61149 RepID=A0A2P2IHC3_RHIMU